MRELPTRREVDGKIDKLAEYVMNEVPTRKELDSKLEKRADKKWLKLLDGQDKIVKELEAIRPEHATFDYAFGRIEKIIEKL